MSLNRHRPTMVELLRQPSVIDQLRERFRYIQDNLTTSIGEASELSGLTDAQLRYAETRGMFSTTRDSGANAVSPKGQRRYTVDNLLHAHLIEYLLGKDYSLVEISAFMQNNPDIIQDVLETKTLRLTSALDSVDLIQFNRFVLPRLLYYALSLIFERDAISNVGIIIPVRAQLNMLDQLDDQPVEETDELARLGSILVGWRPQSGPMVTFLTSGNPFEREQRIRLKPLSSLLALDATESAVSSSLVARASHIFIALEPQLERELDQVTNNLRLRRERTKNTANSRMVAARLTMETQRIFSARMALGGDIDLVASTLLIYTAPDLVDPGLGDTLLNHLTDTLVELGGKSEQRPEADRWRFACILTPRDPQAPLKQQELVVRAQSRLGPHRIGVTTTSPMRNGGLTFRAFNSGRIISRPVVTPLDPAISYADIEAPISSAIAAPTIDGPNAGQGYPPAVIYIISEENDAFDYDDFLLIRVMGRIVGEIVQTYNSRGFRLSALTDALANPEVVDSYFAAFLSDTTFSSDLTTIFHAIINGNGSEGNLAGLATLDTLTLVGFDVIDYTSVAQSRSNQVTRKLTLEIGLRAQQRMDISFSRGGARSWLYRAWGDRFYMLIRDAAPDVARARSRRIRQHLSEEYHLEVDTPVGSHGSTSQSLARGSYDITVTVRMAGMTFMREELRALAKAVNDDVTICAASLTRLLDDGLAQAKEASVRPEPFVWWDSSRQGFEPESVDPPVVDSTPPQAAAPDGNAQDSSPVTRPTDSSS